MSSSTRAKIIKFVKNTYNSLHKVPSTSEIVENVPEVRSVRHLYDIFPGKLEAICEAAGVPVPEARIRQTNKAREKGKASNSACGKIHLSEKQNNRLLGIGQLEGGKDPSKIVDDLLDRDTTLRYQAGLTIEDTKIIVTFISAALVAGWSKSKLIPFTTQLWNNGLTNLSSQEIEVLLALTAAMKAKGIDPKQFVKEATDSKSAVNLFVSSELGNISAAEMARRLGVE